MAIPSLTTKLSSIPSPDFTKDKLIGKGSFGSVYYGTWNEVAVAIKELFVQSTDKLFSQEFQHEALVMASCQHPHIVRLYGICLEPGKFAFLMEYLEKGSLYRLLRDTDASLPWSRRYSIAVDVGKGLTYLHSQNIIHRDLKSLNILLNENDTAKITDFGLAKVRLQTSRQMSSNQPVGSMRWMAPELLSKEVPASFVSDIYSFGLVLWEIASLQIPFSQATNDAIVLDWKFKNKSEAIPSDCPGEYAQIIQKCWVEPNSRPSAKMVTKKLSLLQQRNSPSTPPLPQNLPLATEVIDLSLINPSEPSKGVISGPNYISTLLTVPVQAITPKFSSIAFGKAEWAKYFGGIGVEPPLPSNIQAILQSSCPFWPDKKVQDTHVLVLIPQTVDGKPLTLRVLGDLIQNPKQGSQTNYDFFWNEALKKHGNAPAKPSYWVLFTRDVIPGSQSKPYTYQQKLVAQVSFYQIPKVLEAAVCIFMEHARVGVRLYGRNPLTYTRCQEKTGSSHLVVGGFGIGGLSIFSYNSIYDGIGGLRKL